MLEHLDTLIAFAVVMLLLSLFVTVLVQMAIAVSGLRGRNLRWGIMKLLAHIDDGLAREAKQLAEEIVSHPAVRHLRTARAVAIRREELIALLRRKAAKADSPSALRQLAAVPGLSADEQVKAQAVAAALASSYPKEAAALEAVVHGAMGSADKLWSEVNAWFDTFMDRTSERFKFYSRLITTAAAAVIAVWLQIDSLSILRQLRDDAEVRARLVQMTDSTLALAEEVQRRPAGGGDPQRDVEELGKQLAAIRGKIDESRLEVFYPPQSDHPWLGILASAVFLSLGAPFWYNALRKLADLRPVVARRVEGEPPKAVR